MNPVKGTACQSRNDKTFCLQITNSENEAACRQQGKCFHTANGHVSICITQQNHEVFHTAFKTISTKKKQKRIRYHKHRLHIRKTAERKKYVRWISVNFGKRQNHFSFFQNSPVFSMFDFNILPQQITLPDLIVAKDNLIFKTENVTYNQLNCVAIRNQVRNFQLSF